MLNQKFDLYKSEWLDLVFTDRNKSYGAYDLRVHYGENVMRALAITVLGFTVAAATLTIVIKNNKVVEPVKEIQTETVVDIIHPPKTDEPIEPIKAKPQTNNQQKPAAAPRTETPTQRYVGVRPTNDESIAVDPKPVDMTKAVGSEEIKGTGDKPVMNATGPAGTGGDGTAKTGDETGNTEPVGTYGLEVMPEPYGGSAAWAKFLQKNLRYPETDVQGRVMLSFIIEKDGKLSDIQILRGISPELDREALRVLKLAPAWKPGQQNGHPVRVKYTIPIVFQMADN